MAKASSSAQHYVECDNCEENAAKFLCKTCVGNLCEPCQSEHLKKKITKNHEIVSLTSHDDMVDVFYCTEHTKKKLECYCNRCRKPVCTDCIIHSHNGHSVKHLSTVYKEIKDLSIRQKDEIDNIIIPKYYGLLVNEMEKRTAFTERADEIQNKIDGHTQSVVEMVKRIGQQTVGHLRKAEKDGLGEMDNFKENIEGTINQLQLMSKVIFEKLEAKPHISIFESITGYNLAMFRVLPSPTEYTLTDFQPQNLEKELNFGNPPLLQSYKETALSYVSLTKLWKSNPYDN